MSPALPDASDPHGPAARPGPEQPRPVEPPRLATDGTAFTIRGIGPDDVAMARRFLDSLSRGTRYFRFGRGDFSYTDEELAALCTPAPERRDHVIAVVRADGVDEMVGSARYVVTEPGNDCEFAVMMRDGWTKRGIASALMHALEQRARERGLRTMHGRILGSNTGMIAFALRQGFALDEPGGPAQIRTVVKSLVALPVPGSMAQPTAQSPAKPTAQPPTAAPPAP